MQDLADAAQKRDEAEAAYVAASHDASTKLLRPSVTGVVQQLAVHSEHSAVTVGQTLMVAVPEHRPLAVEATNPNRDIGFVREGQSDQVKVAAFKYTQYRLIPGKVVNISPAAERIQSARVNADTEDSQSTLLEQKQDDPDEGEASCMVQIQLDLDAFETDVGRRLLIPGMRVSAEIVTKRRRIISYVLSPMSTYAHEAGRER
ncbi:membrane-fusion protein [Ameyamaea chiangmaiensis NBRC 103196]|uniref:HlyD family efflux transporter periplasmic adaptor subunit n=1 Tax=Ameyamaea chiangmaiensis TaxID=442969 RepID=A0A850P7F4_9PROT|nr:HlyD family efflux transporter periplasmic adaptor subunit [Ameyamaea chiangmaiensis]MBS4076372.1 HlyD family efflux transporter periplasmic adaptor subunit [Ameyamaea chiangmaiensis]NVN40527.1 HlyD family efflux transporter periplasmic adaptor subunit [Ameyamaea chiangmaiensis]GBQ63527.1 membrane-fusion protein [Ameyamaea chiangmaiensis NBRC 103196]